MPRTREVPRWRQKKPSPGIRLSRPQEKRLVRQVSRAVQASPSAAPGLPLTGQVIPPHAPVPGSKVMAQAQVFRFRLHLVPVAWLLAVIATGVGLHQAHAFRTAVITAAAASAAIVLLSRHLSAFARRAALALASLTSLWLPFLASLGWAKPWPPVLFGSWLCVMVPWVRQYRHRPGRKQPQQDMTDLAIWTRLAAKNKWSGHLGPLEELPDGGRRYPVVLDGAETHIGQVMAEPRRIAAAWSRPVTEAYAEPSPDGIESTGYLTLLRSNTLAVTREWDGAPMDRESGLAVIGRYPDNQPARIRFYARRDGTRNGLIAGATGSGKSYLLDLLIRLALTSGNIVPVILDPQEGQSLPQWRGHLPYAAGVDECMDMLLCLHAGMMLRSQDLAARPWADEDGHPMTGFDFYDPFMTGLPVILVIADELPVLLSASGRQDAARAGVATARIKDIAKLGRKTGVALWPVTQVPSLEELGSQVVRSMLAGGNVVCLRTGDRVSGGMLGLAADPSELPRYFRGGEPTYGLGYVLGPDNRQAPARIDLVPQHLRRQLPDVPALDITFSLAMDRARERAATPPLPSPASLAAVPPSADDDGPEGRTCADAILAVLDREMTRGQIIVAVKALAEEKWGRPRTFSNRGIQDNLTRMAEGSRIAKPKDGTYAPVRPSLHAVGATSPIS